MSDPLVTIALSAYNVVEFIDVALDCLENQSYTNIEILCIDDCSTDGTYEKLLSRAEKDTRYRVLRQPKNMGLSVSRNRAIDEAKGEYFLMLDGDDLFNRDMVGKAADTALNNDADMVFWDYATFTTPDELSRQLRTISTLRQQDANDKLTLLRRPAFMWTRLLKLESIRKMGIRFTPGLTKQDIPIHWQLVTSLDKIAVIPERLSYYRLQPNATSCRKGRSLFSLAKVMDITGDYLIKNGLYTTYRDEYLRSRLSLLQGMYDFIKPDLKAEAMDMIKSRIDSDAVSYINSQHCALTFRTKAFYGCLAGSKIDCLKYRLLMLCRRIYRTVKGR